MQTLYDLKPGDRVQVFDINGSRLGQPRGGWDGEVVKVGRKLITVKYHGFQEQAFRLETGLYNSKDWSNHTWIKTVEQAQEDMHRGDLIETIREHGLQFKQYNRSDLSTAKLEALVRILEEPE